MAKEYSLLPFNDFYPIKHKSSSLKNVNFINSNNFGVLFLLFTFIKTSISNQENSNFTSFKKEAYFNSTSQIYHLAQDHYKFLINHNFQKLNNTSYYCFKEGTNWNHSLIEGKCICKPEYSLLDCGLNDQLLKTQLLKKQSNCHFKQDIVNIKRMNKPSKIIFAMPLYECDKRKCRKLINELVEQYEYIVDLFIFLEIRNSTKQFSNNQNVNLNGLIYNNHSNNSTGDEKVYLYSLNSNLKDKKEDEKELANGQSNKETILNKVAKVDSLADLQANRKTNDNQSLNQTNQFKNVIYQIKSVDFSNNESKEIVSKVYSNLWNLVFNNVTNYRPNDKIVFLPPFTKINEKLLNFFKFYNGFGEPVKIVDNFYTKTISRVRLPKDIQEDLNEMSSAIMFSFQFAMSICKFKFENFSQNYCLTNQNLVNNFANNYWKICQVTVNALYN